MQKLTFSKQFNAILMETTKTQQSDSKNYGTKWLELNYGYEYLELLVLLANFVVLSFLILEHYTKRCYF